MKKIFFFTIVFVGFVCCSNLKRTVHLYPLFPYGQTYYTEYDSSKTKYYFIDEYNTYENDSTVIDKYIMENIDTLYKKYKSFTVFIFRKSSGINENSEKKTPNEPTVLEFRWAYDNFISLLVRKDNGKVRLYFKKGSLVFNSTNNVYFEDVEKRANEVLLEEIKNK